MTKQTVFIKEIADLLNEVRQLRDDTDSLVCNCNQPDCPFRESHSLDIQQIECSFDFHADTPRLRRKGIAIANPLSSKELKGIERRHDGTIVERDGPRTSGEDSLEKRLKKSFNVMHSSYNHGLGKHLSVSTLSDSQDCLVDSDNLFGTSSDDDSTFSRFEQTRRHVQVRRSNSRSFTQQKRRVTVIPSSNTFPTSQMKERRKTSLSTNQPLSLYLRNAASLPSCAMAYLEDDKEILSTCSSTSSLSSRR